MADNSLGAKTGVPVVVPVIGETTNVTVTGSWVTNTTYTATETRVGAWAEYEVKVATSGAPTATNLLINLPAGRTIDTTKLTGIVNDTFGLVFMVDSGVQVYMGVVGYSSTTAVRVQEYLTTGTLITDSGVNATAPFTWGASDYLTARFRIPILEWAGSANVAYGAGLATSVKAGLINYYDEYSAASTACTGAITVAATYKLTRIGRLVTLQLDGVTGTATANTSYNYGVTMPSGFRPTAAGSMTYPIAIQDNAIRLNAPGMLVVAATGVISVFKDMNLSGTFTNATSVGMPNPTTVSWFV